MQPEVVLESEKDAEPVQEVQPDIEPAVETPIIEEVKEDAEASLAELESYLSS